MIFIGRKRPYIWEFDSCLSVRIPYVLELILVRSDDRYVRSLQMISIRRSRPYILKHTISPGNIYRTDVPYHIPYHKMFPPHRSIIPYRRHKYSPHQRVIYSFHHTVSSYHTTDMIARGTAGGREPVVLFFAFDLVIGYPRRR